MPVSIYPVCKSNASILQVDVQIAKIYIHQNAIAFHQLQTILQSKSTIVKAADIIEQDRPCSISSRLNSKLG